jgi:predicted O-linked N-acetylglucosamine transferase (SPINDLY family)
MVHGGYWKAKLRRAEPDTSHVEIQVSFKYYDPMNRNKSPHKGAIKGAQKSNQINPVEKYFHLAIDFFNNGQLEHAKKLLKDVLAIAPNHTESLYITALISAHEGLHQSAIDCLKNALIIDPKNLKYLNTLGDVYFSQNNFDEAVNLFKYIIELNPEDPDGFYNLAVVLQQQKNYTESLSNYQKVLELDSKNINATFNIGNILIDIKNYSGAVPFFESVIKVQSNSDDAFNNLGFLHLEMGNFEKAVEYLNKAITINPNNYAAFNSLGKACGLLFRNAEALECFDRTIALNPDCAEAHANRGLLMTELKRLDEALTCYQKALELKPDYEYLFGHKLSVKMHICEWLSFQADLENLSSRIKEGKKYSPSFPVIALTDSLSIQRKASEIWIDGKYPFDASLGAIQKHRRKNKIHVGYYSADFHNHATAYLMAELFEKHDKSTFEFTAFSFGPDSKDEMRQRLTKAFNRFIDVRLKSDKEIALLSRQMGIDIAIDLKGFTEREKTGIFSFRAAPIQVSYIGYPGTMAAEYIDYIVADKTLIPTESQLHYSEKILYLPGSYQVNDRKRKVADKIFSKEEMGLPNEGFVFCCFNNNYKITPQTFNGWIKILKAVEGSVLWLLEDNPIAKANLRKEAQARGLNPDRLIFAQRMKLPEHLARHRMADLFIDTFPYNAHTTASDALWAGLPVLTCMGESFASRVAASLLNAIELPELITTTQQQYESTAIELATNPGKLKAIKDKLEQNRLTTALFDTTHFTKHIEAAYIKIYERYQADLTPDHIYIE